VTWATPHRVAMASSRVSPSNEPARRSTPVPPMMANKPGVSGASGAASVVIVKVDLALQLFAGLADLPHALTDGASQLGQFVGPKQDQHHYQNDYDFS